MEKILEKIYEEILKENDGLIGKANSELVSREWKIYDEIYDRLKEEERDSFCEYINILNERHSYELKESYKQGFKTAIRIVVESMKD